MHLQIILCHPLADSYSRALFATIVAALREKGHVVTETDLYRDHFDPALSEAERRSYLAPPYDEAAVAQYTELLRRIDGLILCFPQWWFGMPALLKGYFDRVWAPGIAFAPDPAKGRIRPLLTNIRVFGVVTTYGSPRWLAWFAGEPCRKVLMRALKPMCGRGVRSFYLAHYDMDRSTAASRQRFIERVQDTAGRL